MMRRHPWMCAVFLVVVAYALGCSKIPDHYQNDFIVEPRAGYRVVDQTPTGFDLEVFYYERTMVWNPKPVEENAKSTFIQLAAWLTARAGRTASHVSRSDLLVATKRNLLEGRYEVVVTGRVDFK